MRTDQAFFDQHLRRRAFPRPIVDALLLFEKRSKKYILGALNRFVDGHETIVQRKQETVLDERGNSFVGTWRHERRQAHWDRSPKVAQRRGALSEPSARQIGVYRGYRAKTI